MGLVGGGAVTGGQSAGGAGGGGGTDYSTLPEVYADALDELGVVHHFPFETGFACRLTGAVLTDESAGNAPFDATHAAGIEATQCLHSQTYNIAGDIVDYTDLAVAPAGTWTFLAWVKSLPTGDIQILHWGNSLENRVRLFTASAGKDAVVLLRDAASVEHGYTLGGTEDGEWHMIALRCSYADGVLDMHWRGPRLKSRADFALSPGSTFDPDLSPKFRVAGSDDLALWGVALFDTLLEDAAIDALDTRGRASSS